MESKLIRECQSGQRVEQRRIKEFVDHGSLHQSGHNWCDRGWTVSLVCVLLWCWQSREWVDGSWVMGQMGHENRMGHMGHGSLGVDP